MNHWLTPTDGGTLERLHPQGDHPVRFILPDELDWTGERLYRPTRRRDKAVQVGGVNVYPDHVCRILLNHPLVMDAAVRLMNPEEGERLKAFIVSRDTAIPKQTLILELRDYLMKTLIPAEMPKSITVGLAIPQNSMGKTADWAISPTEEIP